MIRRPRFKRNYRRNYRSKITKTKQRGTFVSDKKMIKVNYDTYVPLIIPVGDSQVTQDLAMSYIPAFDSTLDPTFNTLPLGLANYALFYGTLRVLGSKIRAEFFCETGSKTAGLSGGSSAVIVGMFPAVDFLTGTGNGNNTALYAQPHSRYKSILPQTTGGSNKATLASYMSSKKMFGNSVTADAGYEQYWEYDGSQPNMPTKLAQPTNNQLADWVFFAATPDGTAQATNPSTSYAIVRQTYYIQLEDRLTLSQQVGPAPL